MLSPIIPLQIAEGAEQISGVCGGWRGFQDAAALIISRNGLMNVSKAEYL
jgi:hypothetical protein